MRWQGETVDQRCTRMKQKHQWYAWYPVQSNITGRWVWFEWTYREWVGNGYYYDVEEVEK
jgi:hypothetical protein